MGISNIGTIFKKASTDVSVDEALFEVGVDASDNFCGIY